MDNENGRSARCFGETCELLVHHPEDLGVTADDHHAGYQEAHNEQECLGGVTLAVLYDGARLQIGIVVKFA